MSFLSNDTLKNLPDNIALPTYNRALLSPGIVHIGLGNFHRAHQAFYLHRLMQKGIAHDWAIIGAGVRPYDDEMRTKLKSQDYLSTLVELAPDGSSAEILGSMIDYVPIAKDNRPLITTMAQPNIRIVSLTITEGGYYIDPVSKKFDAEHPDMRHDAAHPDAPRTAFGAIIAALQLRKANQASPFTLQSCDNLQGNGKILRQTVTSLAQMSDPALARWIEDNCTFPNSMVDCIVPATGPREMELVKNIGIKDAAPVTHENFRQWVIEDDFCAGRPPWEKVGATFSDKVHDYETQKIRILNAGHQVLANAAEILGIETICDAKNHPAIQAFFRKVQHEEIIPHIRPVPDITPTAYMELIEKRFANPAIIDTTRRVAFDGSSRHPGFVGPTIHDALISNAPVSGLALTEALWARMCEGTRENGTEIEANDPFWGDLLSGAKAARDMPIRWLQMRHIYGDLAHAPRFADAFEHWLSTIYQHGVETALRQYVKGM